MSYLEAELRFRCSYCGASIGKPCITKSRKRLANVHSSRYESVREIVELTGYPAEMEAEYRRRRALERAIRELHTTLSAGQDVIGRTWMQIRLAELLAVKA